MITNKEKNFISAVVYVHNEEKKLKNFLLYIVNELDNNFEKYEIICVNDKSDDKSVDVIKKIADDLMGNHMVSVINMSVYQGIELSMNAGMDLAIGDFVFEFDNIELDYEEDLIMQIYKKSLEGYDIVAASPKNTKGLSSKIFYKIYNWGAIGKNKLSQETFRILSRRAINRVKALNKSIPYRKALYLNCGLSMDTIQYNNSFQLKRSYEKEEIDNRMNIAIDSLILFTDTVQKLALLISVLFLFFTVAVGMYTVIAYLGTNRPVEGWTPIMGVLSVGFCGVFLLITVMLKYLSIILNMVFKRQKYLIESVEKITK